VPELLDLARRIAEQAGPGEQIEAYVAWHRDTEVRAFEADIESLSTAESSGVGIRVISDHRQGFAYVGDLDEDAARGALAEARDNATFATPDEFVGLVDPDGRRPVVLELYDDGLAVVLTEDKVALAIDLDRRMRSEDARIRQVIGTDYGDGAGEAAIATSTGIAATSRRTTCFLSTHVVVGDGDDSQTGGSYSAGRGPSALDADFVVRDAVLRATRLLGASKPRSAIVDVVFDPRVTASLLGLLGRVLSGEEAAKGRSLFAGRIGEQVAASSITLVDDPTDPRAFGASAIDAEGLACRRTVLIDDGRLDAFLYDGYSARLAGATSTASAVRAGFKSGPGVGARALALTPGTRSQEEILAEVGTGFYVQSVIGLHSGVNLVSGDFSVGAEGLLITDGVLGAPVREVTIASSVQRMLAHVLEIGGDVEWLPSSAAGMSLALGELAMSGE
jgi:PmbA protein